jgi:cell division protease FtsH
MVMRFGMSEKLGPRVFGHDHGQPFLGREFSSEPDYSDDVAKEIDEEIRRVVEAAHQTARQVLADHRDDLDTTSEILQRRETIEREEFIQLLEGRPEDEVFAPDEPVVPTPPPAPEAPERKPERAPKPLPRPGLAGGAAEMAGLETPEKPDLA